MQARPAFTRDNADVFETLQRLQAEQKPAFDPYRVQWRSDRLEWVMKNGFAEWFAEERRNGRAFFPLALTYALIVLSVLHILLVHAFSAGGR